jgi:hypothetical protein
MKFLINLSYFCFNSNSSDRLQNAFSHLFCALLSLLDSHSQSLDLCSHQDEFQKETVLFFFWVDVIGISQSDYLDLLLKWWFFFVQLVDLIAENVNSAGVILILFNLSDQWLGLDFTLFSFLQKSIKLLSKLGDSNF